jgi:hypothetical protein
MKIRISLAVLLLLALCSAISTKEMTAFAGTVSFEGGGLPTPCPPPPRLPGAGPSCVLQIQK